jgi:hypothetical protein
MPSLRLSCRTSSMSLAPVTSNHSHATIPDVISADRCSSDGDALQANRDSRAPTSRNACHRAQRAGIASLRVGTCVFVRSVFSYFRISSCWHLQTSTGSFLTSSHFADSNLGNRQLAQALPSRRVVLLIQHRDLKLTVKPRLAAAGGGASCAKCRASSIYSFCVVTLANGMEWKKGRSSTSAVKTIDVHQPQ